jgi:hypothetical protein
LGRRLIGRSVGQPVASTGSVAATGATGATVPSSTGVAGSSVTGGIAGSSAVSSAVVSSVVASSVVASAAPSASSSASSGSNTTVTPGSFSAPHYVLYADRECTFPSPLSGSLHFAPCASPRRHADPNQNGSPSPPTRPRFPHTTAFSCPSGCRLAPWMMLRAGRSSMRVRELRY